MKRALLAACVALAGCQSAPQRVEVAVAVPCRVERPQRPVWATDVLPADAGLYDRVKALLVEREQRAAYIVRLEAAVNACAD